MRRTENTDISSFILHTAIAVLCIPFYWRVPALFGLAVSPYLLFLIFRPRPEYLFPLIVHMLYGSQQRYMMLAGCFIYSIWHYNDLRRIGLSKFFAFYLLFSPFFIWYTIQRYVAFGGGIGAGGTFEGLSWYLGFSAFFWCATAIRFLPSSFFTSLLVLSVIQVVFRFFVGGEDLEINQNTTAAYSKMSPYFTRFYDWAVAYVMIMFAWSWTHRWDFIKKMLSLTGIVFIVLGFFNVGKSLIAFHTFGTGALAVFIGLISWMRKRYPLALNPLVFIVVSTIVVFLAIRNFEQGRAYFERDGAYNEFKVRDYDSLVRRIRWKFYGDRAPLWSASLDSIRQLVKTNPIWVKPNAIIGEYTTGDGRSVEVELQAHNLLLEVIRKYGFYGGTGLFIVFLFMISQRCLRVCSAERKSEYSPIALAIIGHAVLGSFGGQYLLTPDFSFLYYGLIGACYTEYLALRSGNL